MNGRDGLYRVYVEHTVTTVEAFDVPEAENARQARSIVEDKLAARRDETDGWETVADVRWRPPNSQLWTKTTESPC